jgi:hypothetical protein
VERAPVVARRGDEGEKLYELLREARIFPEKQKLLLL